MIRAVIRVGTTIAALAVAPLLGAPPVCAVQDAGPWRFAGPGFIAVSVADLEASEQWYRRALGLELVRAVEARDGSARVRILRRGDVVVELIGHADPIAADSAHANEPGFRFLGIFKGGFFVEGIDDLHARLVAQGVEADARIGTDDGLGLRTFVFRDPDGNRLQAFARAESDGTGVSAPR